MTLVRRRFVGELVVQSKLPTAHPVSLLARFNGIAAIVKVYKGCNTLGRMLLGKNMYFFYPPIPGKREKKPVGMRKW